MAATKPPLRFFPMLLGQENIYAPAIPKKAAAELKAKNFPNKCPMIIPSRAEAKPSNRNTQPSLKSPCLVMILISRFGRIHGQLAGEQHKLFERDVFRPRLNR